MVYVLSKSGSPLMPSERHGHIRKLLKNNLARVIQRTPFTIQLLYDTPNEIQDIALGVDTGSNFIGLSASTEKKEVFSGEVELRNDVHDNLQSRKMMRRTRRNRKTRYRKARFNNRHIPNGWLPPTILQKENSHLQAIKKLHKILPIAKIRMEIGNFDTQKLENPDISGIEYQQGEQLDFWNTREYVLFRDKHKCQVCHGKSKDTILNVHHIKQRKDGGSDSPKNLITLCETCHKNYHKGTLKYTFDKPSNAFLGLKDAAHMNTMKWKLYNDLKELYSNVEVTFGYITKSKRIELGIEKQHYNDAYIIANNLSAVHMTSIYKYKCIRSHNRSLHKMLPSKGGIRKPNVLPKYMFGYQNNDKVKIMTANEVGFITSRRKSGSFTIKDINGKMVKESITYKKLKLLESRKTMIVGMLKRVFKKEN